MQPDKHLQNEQLQPEEKQKLDQLALTVAQAIKASRVENKDSDDFNPFEEVYNAIKNLFGEDAVTIETSGHTNSEDKGGSDKKEPKVQETVGKQVFSSNPKDLKSYLDQYVVSQDHAKKVLAVAIFNHYNRLKNQTQRSKSNVLLVGPSGSGKTYLIEKIAQYIDVPVAFGDATTLTQAGYVGEDVDSLVTNLFVKAGRDVERAEQGIIFIDEFDKMVRKQSLSNSLDVGGVGVQQAILKMLEGSEVKVDNNNNAISQLNAGKGKVINTKNILFICAGAFVDIEKIIKARVQPNRNKIGFSDENFNYASEIEDYNQLITQVNSDDLIKFGFIPEVLGRIPVIAGLQRLSIEDLVEVITAKRESTLIDFRLTFADFGVNLCFSKQAVEEIAKETLARKTGARGLRSIFESILLDSMFEMPSLSDQDKPKSVIFTKEIVIAKSKPIYCSYETQEFLDEEAPDLKLFTETKDLRSTFNDFGINLCFTKQAIEEIVQLAKARKSDTDSLHSVVEDLLADSLYELPSLADKQKPKSILITKETVKAEAKPLYCSLEIAEFIDEEDSNLIARINSNLTSKEDSSNTKSIKASSKAKAAKTTKSAKTTKAVSEAEANEKDKKAPAKKVTKKTSAKTSSKAAASKDSSDAKTSAKKPKASSKTTRKTTKTKDTDPEA